jgi:microfibrillar-associated protein 1
MVVGTANAAGIMAARSQSQMNFPSKVKRYWPGKAPEWPHDAAADDDVDVALDCAFLEGQNVPVKGRREPLAAELRSDYRRVVRQAEVLSTTVVLVPDESERPKVEDDGGVSEFEGSALEERRKRIRERQLPFLEQEADLLPREDDDGVTMEVVESDSEYYATESEDEQQSALVLTVPVSFISKSQRDTTIAERQCLEELPKKRPHRTRKDETRRMVVELIRREEELQDAADNDSGLNEANCEDELNDEAVEYEAWKSREFARIKRDREEKENNRVCSLTHEEHPQRGLGYPNNPLAPPNKNKRKFLQKYYHKGCFFQQTSTRTCTSIFRRDFCTPTGEDNINKAVLPKVMQVRNFGRRGRTKWTHLVNEDTTYISREPVLPILCDGPSGFHCS